MAKRFKKDPDAVLDYQWDWSDWLATGDTISSYTVTPDTGLTLDDDSNDSTSVTAWLSGGTAGAIYNVVCNIVTTGGREDDRTIVIEVEER